MEERVYRRLIVGSIVALAAIVGLLVVLNPSGDATDLPDPVEAVFPLPGDTVVQQTAIEVDLPVGYELDLEVDGIAIPASEIGVTEATGRFIWQPGPFSLFPSWEPGEHRITIRWQRLSGGVIDSGDFSWFFRVI